MTKYKKGVYNKYVVASYNKTCEPVIQRIMDLKISEADFSQLKDYAMEKYDALKSLEENIGANNVEQAFRIPIFNEALRTYNKIKEQNGSWDGQIESPHFFAYAIAINFIPKEDIAHVNFGSGLSVDEFIIQNFVDVPKKLSNYLFNPVQSTIIFSTNLLNNSSQEYRNKRA